MALRRAVHYVRGFLAEWKEFNRLHQPMPDPPVSPAEAAQAAAEAAKKKKLTVRQLSFFDLLFPFSLFVCVQGVDTHICLALSSCDADSQLSEPEPARPCGGVADGGAAVV